MSKTPIADLTWLTTQEVAEYLRMSSAGLNTLARRGDGPPRFKLNGNYRYHKDDLLEWEQNVRQQAIKDQQERRHYANLRGLKSSIILEGLTK